MAFQSGAFQSGAFQIVGGTDVAGDTHDAGDYKRYRRQLERVIKASERRDEKRYKRAVKKLEQVAESLDIVVPKVITAQHIEKQVDIDFALVVKEALELQRQIEALMMEQSRIIAGRIEDDEEEWLLLTALA